MWLEGEKPVWVNHPNTFYKRNTDTDAVNKIGLEGAGQMLGFILLSCTHQKQLLDRWPFLRLPPGSWQIDTLFLLFIGMCVEWNDTTCLDLEVLFSPGCWYS